MLLEKLRKQLEARLARMEAINAACVGADGAVRALTEAEDKEYRDLQAGVAADKAAISREQELQEARGLAGELSKTVTKPIRVQVVRDDNCNEDGEYRGFKHLGEQLQAIARAGMPGGRVDPRLEEVQKRAASGANEGTGAEGGFAVQTDFQTQLWDKTRDASTLASECEQVEISSPSNAIEWNAIDESSRAQGSRFGGVRAYWRAEAATVESSKPKLRRDRLALDSLMALYYATDEVLEDAGFLNTVVAQAFASEMAFELDDAILRGDGTKGPIGILESGALVQVAKESAQTADTIKYANVRKMKNRIWAPSRGRSTWFVNGECFEQLETMTLEGTSSSVPVWLPAGGISGREYETLFARPVREIEQASALGDLGDISLLDLSQYRLIRKGGIIGASSQHVRFLYGEMTFRWTMRVNGKPLWKTALTPYKGSDTRSPFIALAARA